MIFPVELSFAPGPKETLTVEADEDGRFEAAIVLFGKVLDDAKGDVREVRKLAARGIAGFTEMLKVYEQKSPLKRNLVPEELGATGAFLASDGAACITGQVIYVDGGYSIMGM